MAVGLMLILEGLVPMIAPSRWRSFFEKLLDLEEGQIRFFGMFLVMSGLVLFWLVS